MFVCMFYLALAICVCLLLTGGIVMLTSPRTILSLHYALHASWKRERREIETSSYLISLVNPLDSLSLFTLFSPLVVLSSSPCQPWWVLLRLPLTHLPYAPSSSLLACPSLTMIPVKPLGGAVEGDNSSANALLLLDPVAFRPSSCLLFWTLNLAIITTTRVKAMPLLVSSDRIAFLWIVNRGKRIEQQV